MSGGGGGLDQETYTQIMDIIGDASDSVSFSLTPTQCECTYYKCTSVSSGASAPEGYTLRMQFDAKDFTFTLEDATKTGTERTWLGSNSAGTTYRLMTYEVNGVNSWALYSPTT